MALELVATKKAPAAVGPYSQGVKAGNVIYTSGQLHIDPSTGEVLRGDIQDLTRLSLNNVKAILEEAGASLNDVVKVTVFVKDIQKFSLINEVYGEFFSEHKPARSLVEVSKLPLDGEIEIEAIAIV
ncbi:MAG: RidA family protein [Tissierellaceae bacterium]